MEKFRTIIVEAGVILLGVLAVVFFIALMRQQEVTKHTQRTFEREIEQLELKLEHHDDMFGKYADSISDAMLQDFYPVNNLDSLRSHLKERHEIRLRKEKDGLCY